MCTNEIKNTLLYLNLIKTILFQKMAKNTTILKIIEIITWNKNFKTFVIFTSKVAIFQFFVYKND